MAGWMLSQGKKGQGQEMCLSAARAPQIDMPTWKKRWVQAGQQEENFYREGCQILGQAS